jgi:hypothetical protein
VNHDHQAPNDTDHDHPDPDQPSYRPGLDHLHPDRIRIGSVGVFAGDWACTPTADGAMRIPVGFVGTLIDRWNGWAVFTCTRPVAEAIVAEQQQTRDRLRQDILARGVDGTDADRSTSRWRGWSSTATPSRSTNAPSTATRRPCNASAPTTRAGMW